MGTHGPPVRKVGGLELHHIPSRTCAMARLPLLSLVRKSPRRRSGSPPPRAAPGGRCPETALNALRYSEGPFPSISGARETKQPGSWPRLPPADFQSDRCNLWLGVYVSPHTNPAGGRTGAWLAGHVRPGGCRAVDSSAQENP